MPTVGYEEQSAHTKLHVTLKNQVVLWKLWLQAAELDAEDHFGRSIHSLIHLNIPLDDLTEAEKLHWVSTKGLLVLLASWQFSGARAR